MTPEQQEIINLYYAHGLMGLGVATLLTLLALMVLGTWFFLGSERRSAEFDVGGFMAPMILLALSSPLWIFSTITLIDVYFAPTKVLKDNGIYEAPSATETQETAE